ncbi:MAG: NAD(P)-dependent oxidoreductase [Candidatus Micrarchaeia archaeon]
MKRILVTGATGFIGRHCLDPLEKKGYEIHAVSSRSILEDGKKNIFWYQVDLMNFLQVEDLITKVRPSHLLHLAWYTVPGKYWTSLENLKWVQASINLLKTFGENGGQRVLIAGTCAEYDWRYGYCSETITPLAPKSLYGICKHSLQLIVSAFAKQTGISAAWGRIFFTFGPHEHPDRIFPYVILSLLKNQVAHCTDGKQVRDFLYVEDVAEALVEILDSSLSGPINIASGNPIRLRDLIYKIAEKLKKEDLVKFGSIATPQDEPPFIVGDIHRLKNELGWKPKYDLEKAIEKTIEWWKNR